MEAIVTKMLRREPHLELMLEMYEPSMQHSLKQRLTPPRTHIGQNP